MITFKMDRQTSRSLTLRAYAAATDPSVLSGKSRVRRFSLCRRRRCYSWFWFCIFLCWV